MIISTNQELRLHVPSNAIDDVALLQGVLDNSEHDFLQDKLGTKLYNRLCAYYKDEINPDDFYTFVTNGDMFGHPWMELLTIAQRMVANDAMARYAYQQTLSINSAGVNMASGNDYAPASDKMLDKGVQGFKREAMVSLNNLLLILEQWARLLNTPEPITDEKGNRPEDFAEIEEIVVLWQESKYYYLHHDLLIPTCTVLQQYLDIYDNRDKFIRLLPDLRFIQEEYIADAFGEDFVASLLLADDRDRLLKKTRRMMVAHLEERTTVLSIDKARRQQAHDEAVSLKASILAIINEQKKAEEAPVAPDVNAKADAGEGYQNNQSGSKIFVSPMLY